MDKRYFAISDPYQDVKGCQGFIIATIAVIGERDEQKNLEYSDDPNANDSIYDNLMFRTGLQITCEVYKAEDIVPVHLENYMNPDYKYWVRIRYAGSEM